MTAFVKDRCKVGNGCRVSVDELFDAWSRWWRTRVRNIVPTKPMFGRDLVAAYPTVQRRRGSENVPYYEGITLSP